MITGLTFASGETPVAPSIWPKDPALTFAPARGPERAPSSFAAGGQTTDYPEGVDRGLAVRLTLALWTLAFISFVLVIAAGSGLSVFVVGWLFFTAMTGVVVSAGVFGGFRVLTGLPTPHRRAALTALVMAAAVLQALFDGLLLAALNPAAAPSGGIELSNFALNTLIYFWLFGLYVSILELLTLQGAALAQARLVADYERRLALARDLEREAQLSLLRFQLDPDFIFNVLNNISSMVVTGDTAGAERAIARLCRFLRAARLTGEGEMISLSHELATVEAYLDIEAMRFSERAAVSLECPPDLHAVLVPTLILQPVVEHLVMRARSASAQPMWIDIRVLGAAETILVTMTTAAGAPDGEPVASVGDFDAVRRRLDALYGDKAILRTHADNDVFSATLSLSRIASRMQQAQ